MAVPIRPGLRRSTSPGGEMLQLGGIIRHGWAASEHGREVGGQPIAEGCVDMSEHIQKRYGARRTECAAPDQTWRQAQLGPGNVKGGSTVWSAVPCSIRTGVVIRRFSGSVVLSCRIRGMGAPPECRGPRSRCAPSPTRTSAMARQRIGVGTVGAVPRFQPWETGRCPGGCRTIQAGSLEAYDLSDASLTSGWRTSDRPDG